MKTQGVARRRYHGAAGAEIGPPALGAAQYNVRFYYIFERNSSIVALSIELQYGQGVFTAILLRFRTHLHLEWGRGTAAPAADQTTALYGCTMDVR